METRTLKISHISDTHGGGVRPLRGCDLLFLSGDIPPNNVTNFTFLVRDGMGEREVSGDSRFWNFRKINREAEHEYQHAWFKRKAIPEIRRRGLDINDVVYVNGNHCFVDASDLFPNYVYQGAKTITLKGVKIGILSGVLPYSGEWNDEVEDKVIESRIMQLDRDIDILVSHVPCRMILDKAYNFDHIGSQSIYNAIFGHIGEQPYFTNLRLHCFGHAHDARGKEKHTIDGRDIVFSNASNTRFDIDFKTA